MYKSYMVYSIAKYIEHRILARNRPILTKITETCDRVSFGAKKMIFFKFPFFSLENGDRNVKDSTFDLPKIRKR